MKKIILAITVAIATNYPWVNIPVRAQNSNNQSAEKTKMANEAIEQHFTCYSNMLETGTGNSKDCDDRFRQQLNQNGLCEYVSERLRQRFCKNSSDADGKFK